MLVSDRSALDDPPASPPPDCIWGWSEEEVDGLIEAPVSTSLSAPESDDPTPADSGMVVSEVPAPCAPPPVVLAADGSFVRIRASSPLAPFIWAHPPASNASSAAEVMNILMVISAVVRDPTQTSPAAFRAYSVLILVRPLPIDRTRRVFGCVSRLVSRILDGVAGVIRRVFDGVARATDSVRLRTVRQNYQQRDDRRHYDDNTYSSHRIISFQLRRPTPRGGAFLIVSSTVCDIAASAAPIAP